MKKSIKFLFIMSLVAAIGICCPSCSNEQELDIEVNPETDYIYLGLEELPGEWEFISITDEDGYTTAIDVTVSVKDLDKAIDVNENNTLDGEIYFGNINYANYEPNDDSSFMALIHKNTHSFLDNKVSLLSFEIYYYIGDTMRAYSFGGIPFFENKKDKEKGNVTIQGAYYKYNSLTDYIIITGNIKAHHKK